MIHILFYAGIASFRKYVFDCFLRGRVNCDTWIQMGYTEMPQCTTNHDKPIVSYVHNVTCVASWRVHHIKLATITTIDLDAIPCIVASNCHLVGYKWPWGGDTLSDIWAR